LGLLRFFYNCQKMKTVVLGASINPSRASHQATTLLQQLDLEVVPVGIREGMIGNQSIQLGTPDIEDVHTLTLYIGKDRQAPLVEYMISLNPERVIFNPGTENAQTIMTLRESGIATEIACTLVLLRTGQYLARK